jgi:hypothetical protein
VLNPTVLWFGFKLDAKAALWQELQSVGVLEYTPFLWQAVQFVVACAPVKG